jgi:hypothetical protein
VCQEDKNAALLHFRYAVSSSSRLNVNLGRMKEEGERERDSEWEREASAIGNKHVQIFDWIIENQRNYQD